MTREMREKLVVEPSSQVRNMSYIFILQLLTHDRRMISSKYET